MTIICGACGEEMELPTGGLIAGQHVICPHCGEKTVYNAPTRIEIPIGAIPKQKLGIRRSSETTPASQVDLNAQAIIRKMDDEAREKAAEEARAAIARRKARREAAIRYALGAIAVAAVVGGTLVWYGKHRASVAVATAKSEIIIKAKAIDKAVDTIAEKSGLANGEAKAAATAAIAAGKAADETTDAAGKTAAALASITNATLSGEETSAAVAKVRKSFKDAESACHAAASKAGDAKRAADYAETAANYAGEAAAEVSAAWAAITNLAVDVNVAADADIGEMVKAAGSKVEGALELSGKTLATMKAAKASAEESIAAKARAEGAMKEARLCLEKAESFVIDKKNAAAAANQVAQEEAYKARQKFTAIEDHFNKMNLTVLPKKKMPGTVDGSFFAMIPMLGRKHVCCELKSKADGTVEVEVLTRDGDVEHMEFSNFKEKVNKFGGLFLDGESAYCTCPEDGAKWMPLPESGFVPSDMRMGDWLADMILKKSMSTKMLSFTVDVSVPGKKGSARVATVGYGEILNPKDVHGALRRFAKVPKYKVKPPSRPTVILYNGRMIKKEMNRTLVPENPTSDRNWNSLYSEAMRQKDAQEQWQRDKEAWEASEMAKQLQDMRSSCTIRVSISSAQ